MTEQAAQSSEQQAEQQTSESSTEAGSQEQATQAQGGDWLSGLDPKYHDIVAAKGWKTPDDMMHSYTNLESYVGKAKNNAIVLPENDDDAESWGKVWDRLGRPEAPNGYQFGDVDLNDPAQKESYEAVTKILYDNGIPKKQGEALISQLDAMFDKQQEAGAAQLQQFAGQNEAALRKELGQTFDDTMKMAEAAAKSVGLSAEDMAALKSATIYPGLMKALAKVGAGMQEDGYVPGGQQGAPGYTPQQAKAELAELQADRDYTDAMTNPARHKVLREKAKLLYKAMNPQQD